MDSDAADQEAVIRLIILRGLVETKLTYIQTPAATYNQTLYGEVVGRLEQQLDAGELSVDVYRITRKKWDLAMEAAEVKATGDSTAPGPADQSRKVGMSLDEIDDAELLRGELAELAERYYEAVVKHQREVRVATTLELAASHGPAASRLFTNVVRRLEKMQQTVSLDFALLYNPSSSVPTSMTGVQMQGPGTQEVGEVAASLNSAAARTGVDVSGQEMDEDMASVSTSRRFKRGKRSVSLSGDEKPDGTDERETKKFRLSGPGPELFWPGRVFKCCEHGCEDKLSRQGEFEQHMRKLHGRRDFRIAEISRQDFVWHGEWNDTKSEVLERPLMGNMALDGKGWNLA